MNTKEQYPLVSVIIPFYNHNHFIKQTLDSILEDRYPNKEVIIINDGSPDPDDSNIVNWIELNKENISIKYIKRENKGVTKTLNELILLSKGEYILPCSSDDYLINDTITSRVKLLEDRKDKLILISDNIVIDDAGKKVYDSNLFEYHKTDKEKYFTDDGLKYIIINQWAFAGPTWIAKKELFKKIGYFNEDLIVEDWDFFLRVILKEYALFYDEKVSAYRLHDNGACKDRTKRIQMYRDQYKVALNNANLYEGEYRDDLLKISNEYYKLMHPSISKKLRLKTYKFRKKIKDFFKNAK